MVPLVCKDWYQASQSPELWRSMEIYLTGTEKGPYTRPLLQAPARKFLERKRESLQSLRVAIDPEDPFVALEILAGASKALQLRKLDLEYRLPGPIKDIFLEQAEYKRILAAKIMHHTSDGETIMHRLSQLKYLTELRLHGIWVNLASFPIDSSWISDWLFPSKY